MPARRDHNHLRPPGQGATGTQRAMYNLGHASSSGNLVSRTTDGLALPHAGNLSSSALPSTSTTSSSAYHPVPATEAPYLTNIESHFGRMTLTAPDNMRRKQAKEKKLKVKQKKAHAAHVAAAALAGVPSHAAEAGYDGSAPGPSNLARPAMHRGVSSGYSSSGHATPAAAASSSSTGRRTPVGHTAVNAATVQPRRRPASNSRLTVPASQTDPASHRPASRSSRRTAEQPSRPASSLSQNAGTTAPASSSTAASPSRSRQASSDGILRSRSDSAPASGASGPLSADGPVAAERSSPSQQAHLQAHADDSASARSGEQDTISSALAQQASLRRYNIWNDLAGLPGAEEPDPDDLPPPFPEGATRPRTPPQPPPAGREWTEEERLAYEEAERWRVPDSPPPAFRTDPESDGSGREDNAAVARSTRGRRSRTPATNGAAGPDAASTQAGQAARASTAAAIQHGGGDDSSSLSESSTSEAEAEELAQERHAWEADIQAGLSFEERLMREQERREARERALLIARGGVPPEWTRQESSDEERDEPEQETDTVPAAEEAISTGAAAPAEAETTDRPHLSGDAGSDDEDFHETTATHAPEAPTAPAVEAAPTEAAAAAPLPAHDEPEAAATPHSTAATTGTPVSTEAAPSAAPRTRSTPVETATAPVQAPAARQTKALYNEPRLGASAGPSHQGHRRTTSETLNPRRNGASSSAIPKRLATRTRTRPASESHSRFRDDATAAAERRSNLRSRTAMRPEDMLLPVSAPPPRFAASSDQLVGSSASPLSPLSGASRNTAAIVSSSDELQPSDAESDSSVDQWLAEAAAFDALRRKEEAAAERLRKLRAVPTDGDGDDSSSSNSEDGEALAERHVPGHFEPARPSLPPSPGLNRLAWMGKSVAKAPPPLVLGRSRGGAAYSSSSESSDTDEGRLPSSSGSEPEDAPAEAWSAAKPLDKPAAMSTTTASAAATEEGVAPTRPTQAPIATLRAGQQTAAPPGVETRQSRPSSTPVPPKPDAPSLQRASSSASARSAFTSTADATGPSRNIDDGAKGAVLTRQGTVYVPITLRMAEEPLRPPEPETRAGLFQHDSSSSRDVSSDEETRRPSAAPAGSASLKSPPVPGDSAAGVSRPSPLPRESSDSLSKNLPPPPPPAPQSDYRAAGSSPSGKAPISNRLRGLFGTPLVEPAPAKARTSSIGSSAQAKGKEPVRAVDTSPLDEAPRVQRRPSAKSVKSDRSVRLDAGDGTGQEWHEATSVSSAVGRRQSLQKQPSTSSLRSVASRQPSYKREERPDEPDEQRATEEVLAQIAELHHGRWGTGVELASGSSTGGEGSATAAASTPASASGTDLPQPRWPGANRLSRQGAVHRTRDGPPPPPPVSYNMRPSARPASFINPRSSVAPLPRGRLPTITDATRHFPPSRQNTGVVRTPSWLAHIPSAERSQLPPPLIPDRIPEGPGAAHTGQTSEQQQQQQEQRRDEGVGSMLSSSGSIYRKADVPAPAPLRTAGSRVSAMISKFEVPGSPQASAAPASPLTSEPVPTAPQSIRERPVSTSTSMLPPRQQADPVESYETLGRRPPPPPPPMATASSAAQAASRRPLSSTSLAPPRPHIQDASGPGPSSTLAPPTGGAGLPRSPRTQALDLLTRRESGTTSQQAPPSLPPKSPLLPPEQLFHPSRRGLNETLAAAQAASRSRRETRPQSSPVLASNGANGPTTAMHAGSQSDLASQHRATPQQRPLPVPGTQSGRPLAGLFGPVHSEDLISLSDALPSPPPPRPPQGWQGTTAGAPTGTASARSGQARPLPTLPSSVAQWSPAPTAIAPSAQPRGPGSVASTSTNPFLRASGAGYSPTAPPRPPPLLPERPPRNRIWDDVVDDRDVAQRSSSPPPASSSRLPAVEAPSQSSESPFRTAGSSRLPFKPPTPQRQDSSGASLSEDREVNLDEEARLGSSSSIAAEPSAANLINAAASAVGRSDTVRSLARQPPRRERGDASPPLPSSMPSGSTGRDEGPQAASDHGTVANAGGGGGSTSLQRAPSLGYTDLDLLVSRLEALQSPTGGDASSGGAAAAAPGAGGGAGADYDLLTTLSEFLGPAKSTVPTSDEISSLPLARVECERRRVTREGKVKQKLSVVGVRVDRCGVCLDQFRVGNWAVLCRCRHVLHEACATRLFRMVRTCPTCRRDCFVDADEAG
ncbi:uncharacterized protein PSFLO_07564 [Pseudozyma flocculosa]|uniref:RING-type domain-containing protein n=1 Tax=Pseudozyma flocculosa TaxID=84751 RepID=A0A5C3FF27_9BASI|nr:uncharacterized protein PSFLO_07564 [Pseudozyma flocculosa]